MQSQQMLYFAKQYDKAIINIMIWEMNRSVSKNKKVKYKKNLIKICEKIVYVSKAAANSAGDGIVKRSRDTVKSVYYCQDCGGWHFSRISFKEYKNRC